MNRRGKEQLELFEEGEGAGASTQGPYELPPGWCWTTLGQITSVTGGVTKNEGKSGGKVLPYLRVANVYADELRLDDVREIRVSDAELARTLLRKGDLLIVEGNGSIEQIGRLAIWDGSIEPCVHQNHLIKVRPSDPEWARWFLYWLLSSEGRSAIVRVASSTSGLHTLSLSKVESLSLPLCPLRERDEIVGALDTQFSKLDAAEAGLRRVQANLKRYRAAVLQAAVEGRLVPTEAELARREGRDYEPASALLDGILTERRRRWEEAELARFTAKGKPPRDDAWKAKYQEPAAPDTRNLPALPEGWCWATLDQMADVQGGIQKGKQRKTRVGLRAVPYLRVANVQRGYLDLGEIQTIEATEEEIAILRLQVGDVLFNEGGDRDKLGRGWVWNGEIDECIHQNHVFRARLRAGVMLPRLLSWYGNTTGQRYFFEEGKQTTNLASLNSTKLRNLPVPVPPRAEQERIANELDVILPDVDACSASVNRNLARCQRLRQAILKQAFEGKLVAQDPDDEPASALLARIRAAREAPATPATPRTTSSRAGRAKPARERART